MKSNPSLTTAEEDAMALAELIYDIYKEQRANVKINNGQNNADEIKEE